MIEGNYDVVLLEAEDWCIYGDQYCKNDEFKTEVAFIAGFLVEETESKVVVALEDFHRTKSLRNVLAIPKSCIKDMKILVKKFQ